MYAMGAPKGADVQLPEEGVDEISDEPVSNEAESEPIDERTPKQILKDLLNQSKTILSSTKEGLSAKRKQDLRALSKSVRRLMSKAGRSDIDTKDIESQFDEIQQQLRLARDSKESGVSALPSEQSAAQRTEAEQTADAAAPSPTTDSTTVTDVKEDAEFGKKDESILRRALQALTLNPVDESKPYATPWTPRDYLPAFAFIPRYLEVNQNICAAVYLRHPVAKPGFSEVPTPFSEQANANAFAWYLRRR